MFPRCLEELSSCHTRGNPQACEEEFSEYALGMGSVAWRFEFQFTVVVLFT